MGFEIRFFAKLQLEMKSSTNDMWKIIFEFLPRKLSFSLYVEFSEKQNFLPPDTHAYVDVSEVKKC